MDRGRSLHRENCSLQGFGDCRHRLALLGERPKPLHVVCGPWLTRPKRQAQPRCLVLCGVQAAMQGPRDARGRHLLLCQRSQLAHLLRRPGLLCRCCAFWHACLSPAPQENPLVRHGFDQADSPRELTSYQVRFSKIYRSQAGYALGCRAAFHYHSWPTGNGRRLAGRSITGDIDEGLSRRRRRREPNWQRSRRAVDGLCVQGWRYLRGRRLRHSC